MNSETGFAKRICNRIYNRNGTRNGTKSTKDGTGGLFKMIHSLKNMMKPHGFKNKTKIDDTRKTGRFKNMASFKDMARAFRLKNAAKKLSIVLMSLVITVCSINLNGFTVEAATLMSPSFFHPLENIYIDMDEDNEITISGGMYGSAYGYAVDTHNISSSPYIRALKIRFYCGNSEKEVIVTSTNEYGSLMGTATFDISALSAGSLISYEVYGLSRGSGIKDPSEASEGYYKLLGYSNSAYIYLNSPEILKQPTDQTVNIGSVATFDVEVPADVEVANKFGFIRDIITCDCQWYKNGIAISGATDPSYSFIASAADHGASFYCEVNYSSSENGTKLSEITTSNTAKFYITAPESTNTDLPADVSITDGETAQFSAQYKNAESVQWIYSDNNAADMSTWAAVPSQTSDTLVLNNVSKSINGRYYALKLNGYGGTVAYTRAAKLTVAEGEPQFVTKPQSATVIEGRSVTYTATGNGYAKSYKWKYKLPGDTGYTDFEDSTINDKSQLFVSGSQSPSLTLSNIPLELNGMKVCCVITNETKQVQEEVDLNVMKKSMTGMSFLYPYVTVDYGSTISLADLYVILRYDSGDAIFMPNLSGLTFEDGSTEKIVQALGPVNFDVKYMDETMDSPLTGSFKVNVEDKGAPVVDNVNITWADTGEVLTSALTNDANRNVTVTVEAHDNYNVAEEIQYDWNDGAGFVTGAHSKNFTSENGNNVYKVRISDVAGNISEKTFVINAWDTEAPTISEIRVTPATSFAKYRVASVYADDNVGLAAEAYSYDGGVTWVRSSSNIYTADGEDMGYPEGYPVQVRDKAGNVSVVGRAIITGIDKYAPSFISCEREVVKSDSDDGIYRIRCTIKAVDNLPEETITYSCMWKKSPADIAAEDPESIDSNAPSISTAQAGDIIDIKAEESNNQQGVFYLDCSDVIGVKTAVLTFRIEDEAGNRAEIVQSISLDKLKEDDYTDALDTSWIATPSEWVNAETGVDLICNIETEYPDIYNNLYPSYQFSKDTDAGLLILGEQTENTYNVTENGNYYISMWGMLSGGKSSKLYNSSAIEITNIDNINPELEVIIKEQTLAITANDYESGVKQISVAGGEYGDGSIELLNPNAELNSSETIEIPAMKNGIYTITITDGVGNTNKSYDGSTGEGIEVSGRAVINPVKVGIGIHTMSWTNKAVDATAYVEEDVKPILSSTPYIWSILGTKTSADTIPVEQNGVISLSLEDKWGNIHSDDSWTARVKNIDKTFPEVSIVQAGNKLSINAKDGASGIVSAVLKNSKDEIIQKNTYIPTENEEGGLPCGVDRYKRDVVLCENGDYNLCVRDAAGNESITELTIDSINEITPEILTACVTKSPSEGYTNGNVLLTLNLPASYQTMLTEQMPYSWANTTLGNALSNSRSYSPSYSAEHNGYYYVAVTLLDGRVVISNPIRVDNIDKTAPKAEIEIVDTTARIRLTDDNSGIKKLTYHSAGDDFDGVYYYDYGLTSVVEDIILPQADTYIFNYEDTAGNYNTSVITYNGPTITQELVNSWFYIQYKSHNSARLAIKVPVEQLHLIDSKPFLWSGTKKYTDASTRKVTKNGKYNVTLKLRDGTEIKSDNIKIDFITGPQSDVDDLEDKYTKIPEDPETIPMPDDSDNPVETVIEYVEDDTADDKDKDKAEDDKTAPELTLTEVDKKIVVTVSDNGGISKVTWQKQGGQETTLVKPEGSKEISFKLDPKENGTHTITAYDMNGNKTSKKIVITDIVILPTVSEDSISSNKADIIKFVDGDGDSVSENTSSVTDVTENNDNGGMKWILLIPISLLLILLIIAILYFLAKKKEKVQYAEDMDDFPEEFEEADIVDSDEDDYSDEDSDDSDDYSDEEYEDADSDSDEE